MAKFLRENWIWIVTPLVLVLVGLWALITFLPGSDGDAPFVYNIF